MFVVLDTIPQGVNSIYQLFKEFRESSFFGHCAWSLMRLQVTQPRSKKIFKLLLFFFHLFSLTLLLLLCFIVGEKISNKNLQKLN